MSDKSPNTSLEAKHFETGVETDDVPRYDQGEQSKILRKVDYRLLPMLALLYLLSFLDRGNLGNAKVSPRKRYVGVLADNSGRWYERRPRTHWYSIQPGSDCRCTGHRCIVLTNAFQMFFIPYAIFEIPSNIVLKMLRPSIWMAILVISWGTVRRRCLTVVPY